MRKDCTHRRTTVAFEAFFVHKYLELDVQGIALEMQVLSLHSHDSRRTDLWPKSEPIQSSHGTSLHFFQGSAATEWIAGGRTSLQVFDASH